MKPAVYADGGNRTFNRPTVTTRVNAAGYKDVTYQSSGTRTQVVSDQVKFVVNEQTSLKIEGTNLFSGNRIQGDKGKIAKVNSTNSIAMQSNEGVAKEMPSFKIAPAPVYQIKVKKLL
jgi:hypothetical protein